MERPARPGIEANVNTTAWTATAWAAGAAKIIVDEAEEAVQEVEVDAEVAIEEQIDAAEDLVPEEQVEVEVVAEEENADDANADSTLPAWFVYLRENEYTDSNAELAAFEEDKIVTRATSTPFLARYGFLNELEEKQSEACTFPDISAKSTQMQATILASCKYDLLRGSNGNFIPDRNMTKAEMLTVLVRTKTGYLAEDTTPWFKNYLEYAQTNGIVDSEANIENFEETVTQRELGKWLYRLSQVQ